MPDIRPAGLRGRLPVKPPAELFNNARAASLDIAALRQDIDALHGTGGS